MHSTHKAIMLETWKYRRFQHHVHQHCFYREIRRPARNNPISSTIVRDQVELTQHTNHTHTHTHTHTDTTPHTHTHTHTHTYDYKSLTDNSKITDTCHYTLTHYMHYLSLHIFLFEW